MAYTQLPPVFGVTKRGAADDKLECMVCRPTGALGIEVCTQFEMPKTFSVQMGPDILYSEVLALCYAWCEKMQYLAEFLEVCEHLEQPDRFYEYLFAGNAELQAMMRNGGSPRFQRRAQQIIDLTPFPNGDPTLM